MTGDEDTEVVRLMFTDFELEIGFFGILCVFDYVAISEGKIKLLFESVAFDLCENQFYEKQKLQNLEQTKVLYICKRAFECFLQYNMYSVVSPPGLLSMDDMQLVDVDER